MYTYLLFYIWSWYICEVKMHKIYLLPQVKTNIIADINQHNLEYWEGSKFIQMSVNMEGDGNVYALFTANAVIVRVVYIETEAKSI